MKICSRVDRKDLRRIFIRDSVVPEERQKVERPCDTDMLDSFLLHVSQPLPHLVVLLVNFAEYEIVHHIAHAVMKCLQRIDTILRSAIS